MLRYSSRDYEYAASRLCGTVIRDNKGVPFEVQTVTSSVVSGNSIVDGEEIRCPLSEIDTTPVPLGYVNFKSDVSFICRIPMRGDYRQGMRYNNITSLCGTNARNIPYSTISNAITNKYPRFTTVLRDVLTGRKKAEAWSREWALTGKEGSILYKGVQIVGAIVEDRPVLFEDCSYLQESLQESLG